MCYSLWYKAPTMLPATGRQNNCPKHVELTGIINEPLLLHPVGCLYYLYQWCTVKQISDNEIYLLIKYIKKVLWRLAKLLSYLYIEDARCLKVKGKDRRPINFKNILLLRTGLGFVSISFQVSTCKGHKPAR